MPLLLSAHRIQEVQMTEAVTDRQQAFELLRVIVSRFQSEGRSTRSAGVKPALQFSEAGFDERRLGYRSFRSFLEAAVEDGYITFERAPRGPDVELRATLAGNPTPTISGEKIRRDLWSAFVDWRREWSRVYDRETDRVGWLPAHEDRDAHEAFAALRRDAAASPDRFVAIEPFSREQTEEWMRAFIAAMGESPRRGALESAMTSGTPIRAFVRTALELGINDQWSAFRLARVRERIEAWAAQHGLQQLDLSVEQEPITTPSSRRARAEPRASHRISSAGRSSVDELRDRVCVAVRQMSRGELLRLPIPLEYLIDDERR
jgi:hypothetical protein